MIIIICRYFGSATISSPLGSDANHPGHNTTVAGGKYSVKKTSLSALPKDRSRDPQIKSRHMTTVECLLCIVSLFLIFGS